MFFDQPLASLVRQASARPDMLHTHYAALLADIETRDATLQSFCGGISRVWVASELERLDRLSALGKKGGLFGLPVGVKDTLVVSGLPTKSGTPVDVARIRRLSQSPAVTRLQEAGAVIVAKQATHQFCSSAGPAKTQSARGEEFYVGGSTVGGAVGVAAGFTRLALGSDAAGSIRHPAALAGIAGLRPRKGAISEDGQVNGHLSGQSTGLLARSAGDIAAVFDRCPSLFSPFSDRPLTERAQLTIGIPEITWNNIDDDAASALRLASARLTALGHKIVPTTLWQAREAVEDFFLVMNYENWLFHQSLIATHIEIYLPDVLAVMQSGASLTPQRADAARLRLAERQKNFFEQAATEGLDILMTPSIPWPDMRKNAGPLGALSAEGGRFTGLSNIYDLDSLTFPVEQGPSGWPRSAMMQGLTIPLSRLLALASSVELDSAVA